MRKIKVVFVIIFSLFYNLSVSGQDLSLPKWIEGPWLNTAESNTFSFVFLTFKNDSIFIGKGFTGFEKENQQSLNEKYTDYKFTQFSDDNVFRIEFKKNTETIIYEFKLQNVQYSDKPVLTYSLLINEKIKRKHSTSYNNVFLKLKKDTVSN